MRPKLDCMLSLDVIGIAFLSIGEGNSSYASEKWIDAEQVGPV